MILSYIRRRFETRRLRKIIESSGLFNAEFYLRQYPDVAKSGWNPLAHFARYGLDELRRPSAVFDPELYWVSNPDVAAAKSNPFLHYIEFGKAEGRALVPQQTDPIQPEIKTASEAKLQQFASDIMALSRRQEFLERKFDELHSRLQEFEKTKAPEDSRER
jgi:hypothetical protein